MATTDQRSLPLINVSKAKEYVEGFCEMDRDDDMEFAESKKRTAEELEHHSIQIWNPMPKRQKIDDQVNRVAIDEKVLELREIKSYERFYDAYDTWCRKHARSNCGLAGEALYKSILDCASSLAGKSQVEIAASLYDVARMYPGDLGRSQAECGWMYARLYNDLVTQGRASPEPLLMECLTKSFQRYESVTFEPYEESCYMEELVQDVHKDVVLWFIDIPQLTRSVAPGWLDISRVTILRESDMLCSLLSKNTYWSNDKDDLAHTLHAHGFVLVKAWTRDDNKPGDKKGTYQHIWVHPDGFQVRFKPRSGKFTIGLTLENAVKFNVHEPVDLRLDAGGNLLIYEKGNEILKIVNRLLVLVPAFWNESWFTPKLVDRKTQGTVQRGVANARMDHHRFAHKKTPQNAQIMALAHPGLRVDPDQVREVESLALWKTVL